MTDKWEYNSARWEGDSDYLSKGTQRLCLDLACDYINELEGQLAEAVEALKEVVDAADGRGWEQLDPMLKKQRTVLAKARRGSHES